MKLVFVIYYFCMSGDVLGATAPALWPSQRPIRTMARCVEQAGLKQARINKALVDSESFGDVIVFCREVPR